MTSLRAALTLSAIVALTLTLIPVQVALLRLSPTGARRLPNWYHRMVCRLMRVRLNVTGKVEPGRPVLLVANHASWLDIPVLSAVAPVSFVAKKEVGEWPFVSTLARLQRTVFVDRERRTSVGDTANEMLGRLAAGDAVVLFPEGTSSDGNRVLPFRSPLFAAAKPTGRKVVHDREHDAVVQTVSVVYKRLRGIPLGRHERHIITWYGDMELPGHVWQLLVAAPVDVEVRIGGPALLDDFTDRKHLARETEDAIRLGVIRLLRGLPDSHELTPAPPAVEGGNGINPGLGGIFR